MYGSRPSCHVFAAAGSAEMKRRVSTNIQRPPYAPGSSRSFETKSMPARVSRPMVTTAMVLSVVGSSSPAVESPTIAEALSPSAIAAAAIVEALAMYERRLPSVVERDWQWVRLPMREDGYGKRLDCAWHARSDSRDSSDCPVLAKYIHTETVPVDKFDWREMFPIVGVLRFPSLVRLPPRCNLYLRCH